MTFKLMRRYSTGGPADGRVVGVQFGTPAAWLCVYLISLFDWWKYKESVGRDWINLSLRVTWVQFSYTRFEVLGT